jgi:ATP-binding cassette subfamily B protein
LTLREIAAIGRPYLARYKRGLALGLGALVVKDIAGAAIPLIMREGIDAITRRDPLSTLLWIIAILLGVAAFKGLFQFWMRVILVGISRDVEFDLRNDIFTKLESLDWKFYSRFRTGDIMARATNDLNAVRMMLGPALMYTFETSLTFVLALAVMFSVDWQLTLWALSPAPVVSVIVVFFGRRIHHRFERIQSVFSDITSRVQENLSGARVVRAYVQEEAELRKFEELNRNYIGQAIRLARLSSMFMPALQALIGITFLIVLWVGGLRLIEGKLTIGSYVMFNTYMGILIWPMIAFGWVVNLIERGAASLKRINEILTEEPSIKAPPAPRPLPASRDIEFRNVSMRFETNGAWRTALDGIDLVIPDGATIAIVGRTGAGKSTLVHLIPRLFDPTEGAVLLGGVDLPDLDPAEVRRIIGFVPQETFLFSSTVGENIAFGVESATQEQIRKAAELAGLAPDIEGFPNGYATVVGERGLTLSGGQKQRTAIARALLREPDILILDDALSAVDTVTEERILTSLTDFMRGRTTILISHRVSTVRHADCIYVLDQGRIVEQGTHDQLLALGGYYADLHSRQLLEQELETI